MNILLTGGAGFIGSHAVRRLLQEGCGVLNIDKLTYAGSLDNLGDALQHPRYQFEQTDICDIQKLQACFDAFAPDAVVHMAAETHVDKSIADPDRFVQTNVVGTQMLLHAASEYWKKKRSAGEFRFIHFSTDEVFGALGDEGVFNENSPYKPNSPYAASKAASDFLVRAYCQTYKFPAVIINASNAYGSRQYPEKLIPRIIELALREEALPVYGNGSQIRDWVHVDDHVDAVWRLLKAPALQNSYCLGGGTEMRNIDLVGLICDRLDVLEPRKAGGSYRDLITFVEDRPGHDYRYASDSGRFRSEFGWHPKRGMEDGVDAVIKWHLQKLSKNE